MASGIKVNFSDEEASSEALSFDAIPTGTYHACVTDVTLNYCGPESKNPGKPYWNIEFTVQDDHKDQAGRKVWTNCMLFEGALYTLTQLMKATGFGDKVKSGKSVDVPDADEFIAKHVFINVRKMRDTYREQRDGSDEPMWKNEVKGIKAYSSDAPAAKGAGSLLP